MREQLLAAEKVTAIEWRDGVLRLLDQRVLPFEETWLEYHSAAAVAEAIRLMVVRGAPAIGISAAWGVVLAAKQVKAQNGRIAIAALTPLVSEVFQISRFDLVFSVFDTLDLALVTLAS